MEGEGATAQAGAAGAAEGRPGASLRLHVLASGSKGNAAIVEDVATGEGVLVDCGVNGKAFMERCEQVGFEPLRLRAVVVTHDHSDHTQGLGVVLRGLARRAKRLGQEAEPPTVWALPEVRAACRGLAEAARCAEVRDLALGQPLAVAGLVLTAFPTSHDAAASCGFRVEGPGGDALGYLTDTGCLTPAAREALAGVRLLALESNHDGRMLAAGEYPAFLKARVGGERGHLSNDQAAAALDELLGPRLEWVVAMHLSENNNRPSLVERSLGEVLARRGHGAGLRVAAQHFAVSIPPA